jgi:predicted TIM-barrel fold metal-dependent hydrolase
MIVDSHTHAWPDSIAERALGAPSPDIVRQGDGKLSSLVAALDAAGVDRAVCLSIANLPRQLDAANGFAASLDPARFVGFGSLHAELDVETNLEGLRSRGLRGAKLNPPFQGFTLADRRLAEILDAMQGEFVVLTHVGEGGAPGSEEACTPAMVRELVREFPRLDLIAAHLGGYRLLDEAESEVIGLPVWIDTAWPPGIGSLPAQRVRAVIERHGADRVLFGSDWPMADPAVELAALEALELPEGDLAAILGGNAVRLLRLDGHG